MLIQQILLTIVWRLFGSILSNFQNQILSCVYVNINPHCKLFEKISSALTRRVFTWKWFNRIFVRGAHFKSSMGGLPQKMLIDRGQPPSKIWWGQIRQFSRRLRRREYPCGLRYPFSAVFAFLLTFFVFKSNNLTINHERSIPRTIEKISRMVLD